MPFAFIFPPHDRILDCDRLKQANGDFDTCCKYHYARNQVNHTENECKVSSTKASLLGRIRSVNCDIDFIKTVVTYLPRYRPILTSDSKGVRLAEDVRRGYNNRYDPGKGDNPSCS